MSYLSGSQILMDFSRYTNRKAASHLNKKEASSQKALGMVGILKPAGFSSPLVGIKSCLLSKQLLPRKPCPSLKSSRKSVEEMGSSSLLVKVPSGLCEPGI
jgi:hypothetical protein